MQSSIQSKGHIRQITADMIEEDEFEVIENEEQIQHLKLENEILHTQNAALLSRLQHLETVIIEYATELTNTYNVTELRPADDADE